MPVTQDRLTRLRDFGLSEYAARAYLALLDLGIAEARDVSSLSKVPQAKIYHVLEQLHEKGLVVILPEFPKKYAPVPFEEYLDRLHEEHLKAAEGIEREREDLSALFAVVGDVDVGDRGFFTVLRGRRNVLSKIEEIVAGTKRDLLVLGSAGMAARAANMLAALRAARERNVRVRVLAPIEKESLAGLENVAATAEVRARDLSEEEQSQKVAIVLSDGERAFLIHFVPDDGNLYTGKDIGVFTDQEAMVAAIQAILEPHWARAQTLQSRKEALEKGREPDFTRIYTRSDEAAEALLRTIAGGVRELCVLDGRAAPHVPQPLREAVASLRRQSARFRAILNLPAASGVDEVAALAAARPGSEARHLAPRLVGRHWLVDEREAFFSLTREGAAADAEADLVVHTNNPAVVQTVRSHFEALWATGMPLEVRKRELEAFPHLQPGEVGLGVLFHIHQDAVLVAELDGRVLLWNPAAEGMFGHRVEEALGLRLSDLLVDGLEWDVQPASAPATGAHEGARLLEGRARRKDGALLDVECSFASVFDRPMGRPLLLVVLRDVTARKRAADAEMTAQKRIVDVYERMTEAFFALDRDWRLVYMNPVAERMRRTPKERVLGKVLWEAFPDLVGSKFEAEYRRAMETGEAVRVEERYAPMDCWFEAHAYPSEAGLSIHFRDVTERKRHENEARLTGARHARLFDASPFGLAVLSRRGRILEANARFLEIFGFAAGASLPPLHELVATGDGKALARLWEGAVEGGVASGDLAHPGGKGRVRATLASLGRGPDAEPEYLFQVEALGSEIPVQADEAEPRLTRSG